MEFLIDHSGWVYLACLIGLTWSWIIVRSTKPLPRHWLAYVGPVVFFVTFPLLLVLLFRAAICDKVRQ